MADPIETLEKLLNVAGKSTNFFEGLEKSAQSADKGVTKFTLNLAANVGRLAGMQGNFGRFLTGLGGGYASSINNGGFSGGTPPPPGTVPPAAANNGGRGSGPSGPGTMQAAATNNGGGASFSGGRGGGGSGSPPASSNNGGYSGGDPWSAIGAGAGSAAVGGGWGGAGNAVRNVVTSDAMKAVVPIAASYMNLLPDPLLGIQRKDDAFFSSMRSGMGGDLTRRNRILGQEVLGSRFWRINADQEIFALAAQNNRGASTQINTDLLSVAGWAARSTGADGTQVAQSIIAAQDDPNVANNMLAYMGIAMTDANGDPRSAEDIARDFARNRRILDRPEYQGEKGAENLQRALRNNYEGTAHLGDMRGVVEQALLEMRDANDRGLEWSMDENSEYHQKVGANDTSTATMQRSNKAETSYIDRGADAAVAGFKAVETASYKVVEAFETLYQINPMAQVFQAINGGRVAYGGSPMLQGVVDVGKTAVKALMPFFSEGAFRVNRTQVAQVHEGEMVIPARMAESVRSALRSPSGLRDRPSRMFQQIAAEGHEEGAEPTVEARLRRESGDEGTGLIRASDELFKAAKELQKAARDLQPGSPGRGSMSTAGIAGAGMSSMTDAVMKLFDTQAATNRTQLESRAKDRGGDNKQAGGITGMLNKMLGNAMKTLGKVSGLLGKGSGIPQVAFRELSGALMSGANTILPPITSKGDDAGSGASEATVDAAGLRHPKTGEPFTAGVLKHVDTVSKVMNELGIDQKYLPGILAQIQQESGGDPTAANGWDSNAQKGIASFGLLQTIASTYQKYARPGTQGTIVKRDIGSRYGLQDFVPEMLVPENNIYAALNYVLERYGVSKLDKWNLGQNEGYSQGAWRVNRDQIAQIHQGEMILPSAISDSVRTVLREQAAGMAASPGPQSVKVEVTLMNATEEEGRRLTRIIRDQLPKMVAYDELTRT